MASLPIQQLFAAVARGLVDAQLALDERGRDSLEAWEEDGTPPTVFTWSSCRLTCAVGVALTPKEDAAETTVAALAPGGPGRLTLGFRYFVSPQGGDDPRPEVPLGPALTGGRGTG